ncbi:hypothetical protein A8C56_03620 [Niabella ginsenosidivorans]|uniref:Uncharacterized protein n=1 Tax=Niabella ginsenosidivorans TaxID=1176587 RepID=A0A1A9HZF4_9BACT|nr:hypothetical protein A8C56_03620 [Niabella ginsenosidivorans]
MKDLQRFYFLFNLLSPKKVAKKASSNECLRPFDCCSLLTALLFYMLFLFDKKKHPLRKKRGATKPVDCSSCNCVLELENKEKAAHNNQQSLYLLVKDIYTG